MEQVLIAIVVILILVMIWWCAGPYPAIGGLLAFLTYIQTNKMETTGGGWLIAPGAESLPLGQRCADTQTDIGYDLKSDCEVTATTPEELSLEPTSMQRALTADGLISPIPQHFIEAIQVPPRSTRWARFLTAKGYAEARQMVISDSMTDFLMPQLLPKSSRWHNVVSLFGYRLGTEIGDRIIKLVEAASQDPDATENYRAVCKRIVDAAHASHAVGYPFTMSPLMCTLSLEEMRYANTHVYPINEWIKLYESLAEHHTGTDVMLLAVDTNEAILSPEVTVTHANSVVIDHDHKVVQWFEPNISTPEQWSAGTLIGMIMERLAAVSGTSAPYHVQQSHYIVSIRGLQSISGEADCYCRIWSMLGALMLASNPGRGMSNILRYPISLRENGMHLMKLFLFYLYELLRDIDLKDPKWDVGPRITRLNTLAGEILDRTTGAPEDHDCDVYSIILVKAINLLVERLSHISQAPRSKHIGMILLADRITEKFEGRMAGESCDPEDVQALADEVKQLAGEYMQGEKASLAVDLLAADHNQGLNAGCVII
jgi:hypothetical protein